jgi:16S rRNA (cytosine967-C5)-methyltransferase
MTTRRLAAAARPGADVRARAARAVDDVAEHGASLARVLPAACADIHDARDVALLKALVYGTVRGWLRLRRIVRLCVERQPRGKPALEALICVGIHQLAATRIPAHAAVASTVEAARTLHGDAVARLVNAVLRRYQRERDALERAADEDEEARHAHPRWLLERLRTDWPRDVDAIVAAGNTEPPLWVRINPARTTREDYARRLRVELGLEAFESAHAPAALRVVPAVDAAALPGFADGLVSVQDAAAQLAAPLVDPRPGARILDACAAPGGKTAHLLETCPDARVTALDVDGERLERIGATLLRLGLGATLVQGDAGAPETWWDGESYDRILLDAPCTATGVIRRHPDIKLLRRAGDVATLAREQARLLDAVWPLLAPRGRLVYATCSLLEAENAGQIVTFLARTPDARPLPLACAWGRPAGAGRQILPGEDGMDGFHYSCLERAVPGASA